MVRAKQQKPKPDGVVRQSQLFTAFGPGSMVDLPEKAVVIGGLDLWGGRGGPPRDSLPVVEPRLVAKLAEITGVEHIELYTPPYAQDLYKSGVSGITVVEFPLWFVSKTPVPTKGEGRGRRSRLLVNKGRLESGNRLTYDGSKYEVVPVRFVGACCAGHLQDINWPGFIHGGPPCGGDLWIDEIGASGDLSEVNVRCDCGAQRGLVEAKLEGTLGRCSGRRPWLKDEEHCDEKLKLLIRAASNAYFSERMSVISLPEGDEELRTVVMDLTNFIGHISSVDGLSPLRNIPTVKAKLAPYSDAQVFAAIERLRSGGTGGGPVKVDEFEVLSSAKQEIGNEHPKGRYFARVLPRGDRWRPQIERVVLVHKLTEVVAQVGFTRFEASAPDEVGELNVGVKRAALSKELRWLPAMENRGEGFFVQLKTAMVEEWAKKPKVMEQYERLVGGFGHWRNDHPNSERQMFSPPFLLLHSLSHLLITALSLRCGYPSSSIKERIYALPGQGYGVLLFTGSVDAEGTLGGLVEQGRAFHDLLELSLDAAMLCSNDPVCGQHDPSSGHTGRYLHGAACHGCLLVAETSCEQRNEFLDRSFVVPTVERLDAEFFTQFS